MSVTRGTTLVVVAVLVAAFTWAGAWVAVRCGGTAPEVSWLAAGVEALIAGVVFALGWSVRQYQQGARPNLDPMRAARAAMLAKAACYTGALLFGWYCGLAGYHLCDTVVPGHAARALTAAVAALGAVALAVTGLIVERFCRLPPPDDPSFETPLPQGDSP
jgi:hypothetical protein